MFQLFTLIQPVIISLLLREELIFSCQKNTIKLTFLAKKKLPQEETNFSSYDLDNHRSLYHHDTSDNLYSQSNSMAYNALKILKTKKIKLKLSFVIARLFLSFIQVTDACKISKDLTVLVQLALARFHYLTSLSLTQKRYST